MRPPRPGYGVRGDVRKRNTPDRLPHPDPAVCELMAAAYVRGWNDSADYMSPNYVGPDDPPNPYEVTA